MDGRTGLADRVESEAWLEKRIAAPDPLTVALVDIDDFREFNNSRTQLAGNVLLSDLAELIRGVTGSSDLAARIGGDEFLLAWPGDDAVDAVHNVEQLQDRLRERVLGSDHPSITISAGVAELAAIPKAPGEDVAESLLRAADFALYAAKKAGGDCVRVYRP